MFERVLLEDSFETVLSVPHEVRVLSPYSFRLRPLGFETGEPGFSVLVERSAFRLRARVVLDPLSQRLRDAVVLGTQANSGSIDGLNERVQRAGWSGQFEVQAGQLSLEAREGIRTELRTRDGDDRGAVAVAAALCEFVLDQLDVTVRAKTRPASRRSIDNLAEVAETWEYDPSARDRATREHRRLENWLMDRLEEHGIEPLDSASSPDYDLAWWAGSRFIICEVKSTSGSEDRQLRLGVGQVLHYRQQLRRMTGEEIQAVLLVGRQPEDDVWDKLAGELGIVLLWPREGPLPPALVG